MVLTDTQKARSFQVDFEYTSSFNFKFGAPISHGSPTSGRNVVFSFESAWEETCEETIMPEPLDDDEGLCAEELLPQ